MKKISAIFAAAAALCMFSSNAFAGDTTELLDKGEVDIAPTIGFANITKHNTGWESDIALSYGVADFMTIGTSFNVSNAVEFAGTYFSFSFDTLFTPLDTEHFDIDFDIAFTMMTAGGGLGYNLTPMLEFNYDTDNDMSLFGAYMRLAFPMYSGGVWVDPDDPDPEDPDPDDDGVRTDFAFEITLGLYYMIMPGHQIILEGGPIIGNMAKKLGPRSTDGFVSIGYNIMAWDDFEITSEVRIDIPEGGDDVSAAIMVGAIIYLPMM